MSVACPVFGDLSYLFLASEAAFGTQDASPDYTYLPVLNYAVEMSREDRDPMPYTGMAQKYDKIANVHRHAAGPLSTALYGWRTGDATISLAEYVMAWAFTDLDLLCGLPSKTAQWHEGGSAANLANQKHLGLTVNSATLAGSDENGASITLNLDCLGSDETSLTTAQTIPTDLERLNEFLFTDSTFSIGPDSGSLVAVQWKGFTWQQQRNLTPVFNGSKTPRFFRPGAPNATFEYQIEKADATWDAIARGTVKNEYFGRMVLKGLHNGTGDTGNYAQVTIDFPKLQFNGKKDTLPRSGPATQAITFEIQKPNTEDPSFEMTWAES